MREGSLQKKDVAGTLPEMVVEWGGGRDRIYTLSFIYSHYLDLIQNGTVNFWSTPGTMLRLSRVVFISQKGY